MKLYTATYIRAGHHDDTTRFGDSVEEVVESMGRDVGRWSCISQGYGEDYSIRVIEWNIPVTPENMVIVAMGQGGWTLQNKYGWPGKRFFGHTVKVISLEEANKNCPYWSRAD